MKPRPLSWQRIREQPVWAQLGPVTALASDPTAPLDAREDAVKLLAHCGADAVEAVTALLEDPAPRVRAAATSALAKLDESVLAGLLPRLMTDSSPLVRLEAVSHCGVSPEKESLLRLALADGASAVRRQAARRIASLSLTGWGPALVTTLERIPERPRGKLGFGEPLLEEEAVLGALLSRADDPEVAREVERVIPRVIAIAADEDAYDRDQMMEAGYNAAALLAKVGVSARHSGALRAVLEDESIPGYIREKLRAVPRKA